MFSYRCYLLDEADRIKASIELRAVSDAQATSKAQQHAQEARSPFELWRGHTLILRSQSRRDVSQAAERYRDYATELRKIAQEYGSQSTREIFEGIAANYERIANSLDVLQDAKRIEPDSLQS